MFSSRWVIDPSTFSVPSDSSLWWIAATQKSELICTVKDCDGQKYCVIQWNQILEMNVEVEKEKIVENGQLMCNPLRQKHFQFQEPKVKQ